jgi:hypothetical protein
LGLFSGVSKIKLFGEKEKEKENKGDEFLAEMFFVYLGGDFLADGGFGKGSFSDGDLLLGDFRLVGSSEPVEDIHDGSFRFEGVGEDSVVREAESGRVSRRLLDSARVACNEGKQHP